MTDSYMEMSMGGSPPKSKSSSQSPQQTRGFWNQFHAFTSMALPYFGEQRMARLLFSIMIVLTLVNSGVRVVFSYLVRDFWSALSDQEADDFYRILKQFLIAMAVLAPINVLYRYQRQMLAIHWREWMTERVLKLYFSNRVYYGLERSHAASSSTTKDEEPVVVDNPDQRITEDVRAFTEYSLSLFLTLLMSVVDLVCFSVILYTIMPELFVAIALFASFGTVMTIVIGKVLVQLNFEKLQKEANFRYSLVRIRDNAESIAFLQGEPVEEATVRNRLAQVIDNMTSLNKAVRNLDFFTTYYDYLTWILPIIVVAPEYFDGQVELGVINQSVSAFSHVLDDISIIVMQWESLTEFSAGIDRLYTFLSVAQNLRDPDGMNPEISPLVLASTDKTASPPTIPKTSQIHLMHNTSSPTMPTLVLENLTLTTPNQRTLIRTLNLSLAQGENLLICGPSGAGKSSLLRAIAGLWSTGSGSIQAPSLGDVYFLPQKAYCSMGSLRDQLFYPNSSTGEDPRNLTETSSGKLAPVLSDQELQNILKSVDLEELPQRAGLDHVMDWSNMLSMGEQQRLAIARLLVYRPRFVILDESTSAMDMDAERRMYQLLQGQGIAYISVGHRPSLEAFHHTKLTLQGESYSVGPIVRQQTPMPMQSTDR